MMKAARSMCGCTAPSPARLPMERTQRWAVRRSCALSEGPAGWSRACCPCRGCAACDGPFDAEALDVGGARLTHSQPVQPEEHRERGVRAVVLLGGEQEHAELGAVETAGVRRVHVRSADVLRRVRRDAPVDMGEAVEAAHRRQPPVDRRCRAAACLHQGPEQLDVRTRGGQHSELRVGRPLEEPTQVVAVRVQRATAVATRNATAASCASSMPKSSLGISRVIVVVSTVVMAVPPLDERTSQLRPLNRRSGMPVSLCRPVVLGQGPFAPLTGADRANQCPALWPAQRAGLLLCRSAGINRAGAAPPPLQPPHGQSCPPHPPDSGRRPGWESPSPSHRRRHS